VSGTGCADEGQKDNVAATPTYSGGCDVTIANGLTPPGEKPSPNYHGNGSIWTALFPKGRLVATADDVQSDGSIAMKFPWFRAVRGSLLVTGRRLDGPAPPLRADVTPGYGDTGFQSTELIFPTEGCWEVTGMVGGNHLTFVTLVLKG